MKRLKKGNKSTFSMFGSAASAKDDEGRDEERIRAQMIIDVDAFGREALVLGVQPDKHDSYRSLKELVHTEEGKQKICRLVTRLTVQKRFKSDLPSNVNKVSILGRYSTLVV